MNIIYFRMTEMLVWSHTSAGLFNYYNMLSRFSKVIQNASQNIQKVMNTGCTPLCNGLKIQFFILSFYFKKSTIGFRHWVDTHLTCLQASLLNVHISAQSKNAVSTNTKHNRYIHLMLNFSSIHFHTKSLYVHMFDIVDTPFS